MIRRRALAAALLLALGAGGIDASAPPPVAAAAFRCTDWNSLTQPPDKLWVHVAIKKGRRWKIDKRQQVDFKTYVERVIINEWGPNETNRAQLLAAAIIVKQYAWWYVMHPDKDRTDIDENCFDVGSTPVTYQLYRPDATEKQEAADIARVARGQAARLPLIRAAIEATWNMTLWKTSGVNKGFAHTGYRAGRYKKGCAHYYSAFHLYQQNARRCAQEGESYEAIIRRFYGPNIAIYSEPPFVDVNGNLQGPPEWSFDSTNPPYDWSGAGGSTTELQGDFDGDLRPEIGILSVDPSAGRAALGAFEARSNGTFWRDGIWSADLAAAKIDAGSARFQLADLNGDGADDVVITAPTPAPATPAGGTATAPATTSIWIALSEKRPWVGGVVQDPVIGAPILVGTVASADLLSVWDRDADGRAELVLPRVEGDGRLSIDLLIVPKGGGAPLVTRWWSSPEERGAVDITSLQVSSNPLGIVRGGDMRRSPRSELIVTARFAAGGATFAIGGWLRDTATLR